MPRLTSKVFIDLAIRMTGFGLLLVPALAALALAACSGTAPGSGSPAAASPSLVAGSPTAESTSEATPLATAPTPVPTLKLTPAATPEPTSAFPDAASCRNEAGGIMVTYPAAWQAYADDPRWTCLLFDPDPIVVPVDSELPDVAVAVFPLEEPFATVVAESRDATFWHVLRSGATAVDGLPARIFEADTTGEGFLPAGLRRYAIVVDRGARGSLLIETIEEPGAAYEADRAVLELMASVIEID
jgi:hypothetical protein